MIQTLAGYTPKARADHVPWAAARIDEGPSALGPWTTVATIDLATLDGGGDAAPMNPAERAFTFTAELEHGWYVITFLAGADEDPTDPIPGDEVAAGLLATIADVRRYLHTEGRVSSNAATLDEELLWQMLEAATDRMRSQRPERTLSPDPASLSAPPLERRFPAAGVVAVPDLRTVTALRLDDRDPIPATGYRLRGRAGDGTSLWVKLVGGAYGADELVVTGHWGPAIVWPRVREACIVWVARVFHQRTARFADNQSTPDGGVLGYFRNLPPDVKAVLDELQVPGL